MNRQQYRTTAVSARPEHVTARAPQHEADVRVPLEQALMAAGAVALCVGVLLYIVGVPIVTKADGSLWSLLGFSAKIAIVVFVVAAAVLIVWYVLEQWLARSRQLKDPRPKPDKERRGQDPPKPIAFQAQARTETGRLQLGMFEIDCPAAGEQWLARWFWRVARQNGTGFSVHVADKYHITREECGAIQQAFIQGKCASAVYRTDGQLARVDLNADGLQALWEFVWRHFPHAKPREAKRV